MGQGPNRLAPGQSCVPEGPWKGLAHVQVDTHCMNWAGGGKGFAAGREDAAPHPVRSEPSTTPHQEGDWELGRPPGRSLRCVCMCGIRIARTRMHLPQGPRALRPSHSPCGVQGVLGRSGCLGHSLGSGALKTAEETRSPSPGLSWQTRSSDVCSQATLPRDRESRGPLASASTVRVQHRLSLVETPPHG